LPDNYVDNFGKLFMPVMDEERRAGGVLPTRAGARPIAGDKLMHSLNVFWNAGD
jgi:hypothetical protein